VRPDNAVAQVKYALSDPTRVLEALGLMGEGRARLRQAGGWSIRCPVHEDRSPSCSVQTKQGVILWHCHGCDASGDVLHLIAHARGLKIETDFKQVLAEGARLAGLWQIVDQLEGRAPKDLPPAPPPPAPPPEPPRVWPPPAEVESLWSSCVPVTSDSDVAEYLRGRALDPELVEFKELAKALPSEGALPRWTWTRFGSWRSAGYKLIVPMLDASGVLRSMRCWRVVAGEGPKRLPPSGHKASELVMADINGARMLRGEFDPRRIAITEGEPDFLSRSLVTNDPYGATIGIVSGSWTKAFAERIHVGAHVAIRTDNDDAGDRYAREIAMTLRRRAFLFRVDRKAG
jgi:hypothetical protein